MFIVIKTLPSYVVAIGSLLLLLLLTEVVLFVLFLCLHSCPCLTTLSVWLNCGSVCAYCMSVWAVLPHRYCTIKTKKTLCENTNFHWTETAHVKHKSHWEKPVNSPNESDLTHTHWRVGVALILIVLSQCYYSVYKCWHLIYNYIICVTWILS